MLSKIPEQIMKDWLAKKQADKFRHDIEIMNNDIRYTEAMIDKSRRGETAWKPEEMYPFLEDLNNRPLKRTNELPKIKELERAVQQYLRYGGAIPFPDFWTERGLRC